MHTTTYRQKDNGWQIIISYKDKGKWKQKSRQGFPTKKDAKQYEATLLEQIKDRPQPIVDGMEKISLEQFCEIYTKNKKSISDNTRNQYTNAVHSLKGLAGKSVNGITYLDLQTAIGKWTIKPQTQKQYRCKLNILFRAAVKPYGLIATNPMADIEIEKARDITERLTLSEEQFKKLLTIGNPSVRLASAICYYTGVRRGELLALTWKDIDFSAMTITIDKQYDGRQKGFHTMKPKSKNGFRTIPIPQVLLKVLKQYHDNQPMSIDRRLFRNPHGVYESMMDAIKKIDPRFTVHCLRHTYATNLLGRGIDIRTVAALLGDDTKTVIGTYVHYSDEMRAAAATDIQKIFAQNF